jgi:pimeloyl-ACP methyl ester carboxylesterase
VKTRVLAQPERVLRVNGIELCAQVFGSAADPALLLIGGAASSMDWWEDGFCERLAAGGRRVIRYDQRDTGRSTHDAPGAPTYTPADLIADAVALLDALEVQRAHIAGISMGGGIAMRIALDHPERIASLTLLSTTGPRDPRGAAPAAARRGTRDAASGRVGRSGAGDAGAHGGKVSERQAGALARRFCATSPSCPSARRSC